MKHFTFTLLMTVVAAYGQLMAQTNSFMQPKNSAEASATYTFVSDRRYNVIHELDGEEFIPAQYQAGQGDIKNLKPGQMMIDILPSTIQINGAEGLGNFQILSKYPDRVGYIYELMDEKGQTARLKVVVDQDNYVDLIYLFSKANGEHTFYLAQKKDSELAAEKNYFTGKNQYFIRSYGNLVEKTIFPYSVVENATAGDQPVRIKQADNISIVFNEKTVSTPKGTFDIKEANTFAYNLEGFPAVKSMIEIALKGKPGKMYVFLNFKQQIEFIEVANTRYFLMP
ncbi:hypothetical protein C7N43_23415 [Sphingobacteriales bacterium UPWRP_1]|nr:hypothetical protein B6N25_15545 [Sphingobacteriales bacterium TSM_CSS]PSJ74531.1 hypothetical protein C7N43_23415 [Sphingobacteriales bacterium UPWRP_1]